MIEENSTSATENVEKRLQRGTWPWFILNVMLFPAPAHITLLRVKEQSFGKNIQHLGLTLLLFLVLFSAALLQIFYPGMGRLWMVIPILSGGAVLYGYRSIKDGFRPFAIGLVKTQWFFLVSCIILFTMINLIPYLNLIELNQKPVELYQGWVQEPSFLQEMVIMAASLFLLFAGYIANSSNGVSINRAFILYACLTIFYSKIFIILFLASGWLKIQGGFWMCLTASLLAAILALDYWDAKKVGQYIRRYFFLTCTKGFTFLFLWLCFFGLPQKCASVFSEFYYNKAKPAPVQLTSNYLILNQQEHFQNAHEAAQRIRALSAKAFMDSDATALYGLLPLLNKNRAALLPVDSDVFQLIQLFSNRKSASTAMDFGRVPLFRPMEASWDVMFTALITQGAISEKDIDKYIAGFKKILPKTSKGELPGIYTPYAARHVALATKTVVDFIVPEYKHLEHLVENNFSPLLLLPMAGKEKWATILHMDKEAGVVWGRMETGSNMEKSIQLLFDSNEHYSHRDEIISRSMVPLPLDYFKKALGMNGSPLVVFSKTGLAEEMPHWVFRETPLAPHAAVAAASRSQRVKAPELSPADKDPFLRYGNYLSAVTWVKSMLQSREYKDNLFVEPDSLPTSADGINLFTRIQSLLQKISPLYERHRLDIAYLLAINNHVGAAPELFIKLAAPKPGLSDLIDCHYAFTIGRQLYLLGHHKEALWYLKLAHLRHPFFAEYELWHQIAKAKLQMAPVPFLSNSNKEPSLTLYYKTIVDLEHGEKKKALKRLQKVLEKDSHDSLANHLLNKYFNQPLNERHFFSTPEGL